MSYFVDCECGESLEVADAAAGTKVQCACGRVVAVPSLRELRRLAGEREAAPSPELVVETLLLAGRLPEERHCVLCSAETDGIVHCRAECELAYVQQRRTPWWAYVLGFVTFGWIGVLFVKSEETGEVEYGKDRIFTLPVRVCEVCRRKLTDPAEVREAVRRTPLYHRLLLKYPGTLVTLVQTSEVS